jgi:hypothetical protein
LISSVLGSSSEAAQAQIADAAPAVEIDERQRLAANPDIVNEE